MEKFFNPESIVIFGLSNKNENIPKLILENLIRWGYRGRIFGVNPTSEVVHVGGIKMYKDVSELPIVPDLAVTLIPAKYVPSTVEACGKFGIKRIAIPSGGFNELGEQGEDLTEKLFEFAHKYGVRFVGPNGVTLANTANGLCLPFVPSYSPPRGGFSIISQSGGVGLMLWNLISDENVGMAKFASIGNKLDLDEVDFLEYFGNDPETTVIGLYLESIKRGKEFLQAAGKINKPIILLKSNTTEAGKKAAVSHTAAVSADDDILNSNLSKYGIIRISNFTDFISICKAFNLPPLRGKNLMVMSPAGGFSVMMADLCEKIGFKFADPGKEFYEELKKYSNAGIIKFSNPLDMGDIYNPEMFAHIAYSVMHNDNVDGVVYVSQWPHMPKGENVFYHMFQTDLSKETTGTILSSGKPLGVCLFGPGATINKMKQNLKFPIYNSPEEMIFSFSIQSDFYEWLSSRNTEDAPLKNKVLPESSEWIKNNKGIVGEKSFELVKAYGIKTPESRFVSTEKDALTYSEKIGYPVIMKIVSPDAIHKSDAGGVIADIKDSSSAKNAFNTIKENLEKYKKNARFDGVTVAKMIEPGIDMFIGGKRDESFGPVVFFGYGGIYIEVFKDVNNSLAPASFDEISKKVKKLKSYKILKGERTGIEADIDSYISMIQTVAELLVLFPEISELDLNPVRVFKKGAGCVALDARIVVV